MKRNREECCFCTSSLCRRDLCAWGLVGLCRELLVGGGCNSPGLKPLQHSSLSPGMLFVVPAPTLADEPGCFFCRQYSW